MITEDYVSFETAKLLKEKGFDGKCYKVWVHYTSSTPMLWAAPAFVEGETIVDRESVESAERTWNTIYCDSENKNHGYLAPTLQMAVKWLREVHNLCIVITPSILLGKYNISIFNRNSENPYPFGFDGSSLIPSYEEAAEVAIKYCLKNLI
jgi:hypothetical protein